MLNLAFSSKSLLFEENSGRIQIAMSHQAQTGNDETESGDSCMAAFSSLSEQWGGSLIVDVAFQARNSFLPIVEVE